MAHDPLTYEDLLRIVELIKSSDRFSEFRLKVGDVELELRRSASDAPGNGARSQVSPDASSAQNAAAMPLEQSSSAEAPDAIAAIPRDVANPRQSSTAAATWPSGSIVVRAPMVGTFYRAPQPGAPPFVQVGQRVEPETTVCIIEVMKLMNSISAGAGGIVTRILVDDGEAVETDAPLIVLDPAPAPG